MKKYKGLTMTKKKKVVNEISVLMFAGAVFIGSSMPVAAQSQSSGDGGTGIANKTGYSVERDPFSPVGFKKEVEAPPEVVKDSVEKTIEAGSSEWDEAMKMVKVNGVSSRGSEVVAVINGAVKTVGDSISVDFKGRKYTWVVGRITPPRSVKLRRDSVQ